MAVLTVRLIASCDGIGLPDVEQRVGALVSAATGARWPQAPGELSGSGPWILWRSPTERLVLADDAKDVQALLEALAPGVMEDACAVDLSEAMTVREIDAADLERVAPRLADPMALPRVLGATRLRWAEVPVVLARPSREQALLIADAALDDYLVSWWQYARDGAPMPLQGEGDAVADSDAE